MVGDGPDCCRSGRPVHKGWRVCSGRRALVQQLRLAKASLRPALSSATRVEGPLNNVQNNSFVLVYRLHNNLRGILQNPDRILKKVWPNMQNLSGKFSISFQNKSLILLGEIKLPNSNSTGKSGTQICDTAAGGSWGGFLRLHLVQDYAYTNPVYSTTVCTHILYVPTTAVKFSRYFRKYYRAVA